MKPDEVMLLTTVFAALSKTSSKSDGAAVTPSFMAGDFAVLSGPTNIVCI